MFSIIEREKKIENILSEEIDIIIVGGGITGAGIALDAIKRGMKVVLLEKNDFASGTSSKSTKLIHGGLRYLKQLEFGLVKEVGLERAIVHKNASHLVLSEKMLLPITKKGSLNKFFTNIALMVYDFLAGVPSTEKRKMLDKKSTLKEEPLLYDISKNLIGSGLYYEYRTDDARLTIEVLKKANEMGAHCFNYSEVEDFLYENEKIIGVAVKDKITNKSFKLKAHNIINATGPWTDVMRTIDKSVEGKRLLLTKGVHLVFDYKKFPIKNSIYFDTQDNRMLFAINRKNKTYLGTTDTIYNSNIAKPVVSKDDVDYLLKNVNKMFPSLKLKEHQIESSWAGLRPLIYEDGKTASEVSRKDEIFISKSGLISIAGGKLTGYRKMAEKTVDLVRLKLKEKNKKFGDCKTEFLKVSGGDFNNKDEINNLIIQLTGEAKQIGLELEHIKEWVYRYGSNTNQLLEIAYNNYKKGEKNTQKLILISEIEYSIQEEMTSNISDFLIRRTGRLFFNRNTIKGNLDFIAASFANQLNLNEVEISKQKENFLEKYHQTVLFE